MLPEQRRYLYIQSGLGAALVNALLNGGIGWAVTQGLAEFPVWRLPGVGADLLATTFGVAFGTVLAMAVQIRWDVARGKITPFDPPLWTGSIVQLFPRGTFSRSVALGVVSVPVFATPVLVLLAVLGMQSLERVTFIWVKAAVAAVEGGLVTPLIVLAALQDARAYSAKIGSKIASGRAST